MSPNSSNIAKLSPCLRVRRLDAASETTPGTKSGALTPLSLFIGPASYRGDRAAAAERPVDGKIILRHARGGKALLEAGAHSEAIQARRPLERADRGVDRVDDKAGATVLDHLAHRAMRPGNHRRAAGHRL